MCPGPSVGISISKKIRFYKAVQNFQKKNNFFVYLLINIVYYVGRDATKGTLRRKNQN